MVNGLEAAYASCEHAARSHYENFPVASWLVPAPMRRHVAALYAFARAADDFADEGSRAVADRHRLLDGWKARLNAAVTAPAPGPPPRDGEPPNTVEIFMALGDTIRRKRLPVVLFEDLLSAFTQDVTVTRYAAGTMSWTTAAARQIPSAGWCCGLPATTNRGSTPGPTRSARRCSSPISGRT
jgi:phytoene/squalene synthetase